MVTDVQGDRKVTEEVKFNNLKSIARCSFHRNAQKRFFLITKTPNVKFTFLTKRRCYKAVREFLRKRKKIKEIYTKVLECTAYLFNSS